MKLKKLILAGGATAHTGTLDAIQGGVENLDGTAVVNPITDGAANGTLAQQSVRFDNIYSLGGGNGNGYDLSMVSGTVQADVTYTIYVP